MRDLVCARPCVRDTIFVLPSPLFSDLFSVLCASVSFANPSHSQSVEDPRDVAAEEAGLNYIGLDGNIGCMGMSLNSIRMFMFLQLERR